MFRTQPGVWGDAPSNDYHHVRRDADTERAFRKLCEAEVRKISATVEALGMPPFVKPRHDAAAAIVERSRMRAGLVARAEQVVGAGARLDAVDDLALMRLVIKGAEPGLAAKCDAGSEGYVRELYRIVVLEDDRKKSVR